MPDTDGNILPENYMPTNAVDGQSTYLGEEVRPHILNMFRGMTVAPNPNLPQTLPAEKLYEVETSDEYLEIIQEIHALKEETDEEFAVVQRETLYRKKRRLFKDKLCEWQTKPTQTDPATKSPSSIGPDS